MGRQAVEGRATSHLFLLLCLSLLLLLYHTPSYASYICKEGNRTLPALLPLAPLLPSPPLLLFCARLQHPHLFACIITSWGRKGRRAHPHCLCFCLPVSSPLHISALSAFFLPLCLPLASSPLTLSLLLPLSLRLCTWCSGLGELLEKKEGRRRKAPLTACLSLPLSHLCPHLCLLYKGFLHCLLPSPLFPLCILPLSGMQRREGRRKGGRAFTTFPRGQKALPFFAACLCSFMASPLPLHLCCCLLCAIILFCLHLFAISALRLPRCLRRRLSASSQGGGLRARALCLRALRLSCTRVSPQRTIFPSLCMHIMHSFCMLERHFALSVSFSPASLLSCLCCCALLHASLISRCTLCWEEDGRRREEGRPLFLVEEDARISFCAATLSRCARARRRT